MVKILNPKFQHVLMPGQGFAVNLIEATSAGANTWEHYRYLITSVDYAKQPAIKNQILEQRWDIILIDEAHQVARDAMTQHRTRLTQLAEYLIANESIEGEELKKLLETPLPTPSPDPVTSP